MFLVCKLFLPPNKLGFSGAWKTWESQGIELFLVRRSFLNLIRFVSSLLVHMQNGFLGLLKIAGKESGDLFGKCHENHD